MPNVSTIKTPLKEGVIEGTVCNPQVFTSFIKFISFYKTFSIFVIDQLEHRDNCFRRRVGEDVSKLYS